MASSRPEQSTKVVPAVPSFVFQTLMNTRYLSLDLGSVPHIGYMPVAECLVSLSCAIVRAMMTSMTVCAHRLALIHRQCNVLMFVISDNRSLRRASAAFCQSKASSDAELA